MLRPTRVIQGGMGVGVSLSPLAKAVSLAGGLGTVSGVAGDLLLARSLQNGDPGGHFRRALGQFPFPRMAKLVLEKYFVSGGIEGSTYRSVPMFTVHPNDLLIALTVCASFALVYLAKEGHSNPVSFNCLEKVQMPLIYYFVGAMLADVDVITMGAGIPTQVPGVLDTIASGGSPKYRVQVAGSKEGVVVMSFDPGKFFGEKIPELRRPDFLPIVSSNVLAELLLARATGSIEGFVVETPVAGGHNAPPRGKEVLNEADEPVYGPRDQVDFEKLRALGKPFWVGGAHASPEGLALAQAKGAVGIQAGSIFALCEESGLEPSFRQQIRALGYRGELSVRTDRHASPTGFPFKVVELAGTMSDARIYESRPRVCDLSALVTPYVRPDGEIGYRCASEPTSLFVEKGGKAAITAGARCLCNGLLAATGLGSPGEPPIFTLGDDTSFLRSLMKGEAGSYTAAAALDYLQKA